MRSWSSLKECALGLIRAPSTKPSSTDLSPVKQALFWPVWSGTVLVAAHGPRSSVSFSAAPLLQPPTSTSRKPTYSGSRRRGAFARAGEGSWWHLPPAAPVTKAPDQYPQFPWQRSLGITALSLNLGCQNQVGMPMSLCHGCGRCSGGTRWLRAARLYDWWKIEGRPRLEIEPQAVPWAITNVTKGVKRIAKCTAWRPRVWKPDFWRAVFAEPF
jgi:hypothetical protein